MKNYDSVEYEISIPYKLSVHFTHNIFSAKNPLLCDIICSDNKTEPRKVLVYLDSNIPESLQEQVLTYFESYDRYLKLSCLSSLPGGERIKNNEAHLKCIYEDIDANSICRHSYIIAVGGGALLDVVGFASSTAHRGIRHIRVPSTCLAQADAGVGVKNGINYKNKKNLIGTFQPPVAVINDFSLLESLPSTEILLGYVEAIKVALIKDGEFFNWIESAMDELKNRDSDAVKELIYRSARLHVYHIATSGDPFEAGSVRPLDFGHWSAHKLEQLSNFRISHGEAVAMGIALDTIYSQLSGYLEANDSERILTLLSRFNFSLYTEVFRQKNPHGNFCIIEGLQEFREHLGGELTITLLNSIGRKFEIHEMNTDHIIEAINILEHHEKNRSH